MRDGRRPLKISQEVGDARYDADVGIAPNLGQRRREDLHTAAGQRLAVLQSRISTNAILVDVVPDVGVADQGKQPRHDELRVGGLVNADQLMLLCFLFAMWC